MPRHCIGFIRLPSAPDRLCQCWGEWLEKHPNARRLKGQRVYVGDGIKVSKEGRKMRPSQTTASRVRRCQ